MSESRWPRLVQTEKIPLPGLLYRKDRIGLIQEMVTPLPVS